MAFGELRRSTRSGKEFSPYEPVICGPLVDFAPLLEASTRDESDRISSYNDTDRDASALSALHDLDGVDDEDRGNGKGDATEMSDCIGSNGVCYGARTSALEIGAQVDSACCAWGTSGAVDTRGGGGALTVCAGCSGTERMRADTPGAGRGKVGKQKHAILPRHTDSILKVQVLGHPTPACASKKLSDSHRRRKLKRMKRIEQEGQLPRPEVVERFIKSAKPITTEFDFSKAPSTTGAYGAKNVEKDSQARMERDLKYFEEQGFETIKWDALEDRPITDCNGVIMAVLVAPPKDARFRENVKQACLKLTAEREAENFGPEESNHGRGAYPALNVGVIHGQGTIYPVNMKTDGRTEMAERLLNDPAICALAGFASASFAAWAPDVYLYYKERLDRLFAERSELRRNFRNSIYPAAAFNLGPRVCTFKHRDVLNCPFGWCSVQALGDFDPTKGGHLVLWELKLVVEFPAGSLILLPSSTIAHSNIPVAKGDTRLSFTQYAAGGLFRYVDYNMRTEKELQKEDPTMYQKMMHLRAERWRMGLKLMNKLEDRQK